MPSECAIDTSVLQKANATISQPPRPNSQFARRVALLQQIQEGTTIALISKQLLAEYERKVTPPRNDFVRAFFELLVNPTRCVWNYSQRWSGADREKARNCRYPVEDDHVLRTAIRPRPSTIITEEHRMLKADACIYREFRVHIKSV